MKRAAEILEFLAKPETPNSVLIAPSAPPVTRAVGGGMDVALNILLDAGDVYDTIAALMAQAGHTSEETMRPAGTFPVVVPGVGRFRVQFSTQRGSKVARISFIPFITPTLESLVADANVVSRLYAIVESGDAGMMLVTGPDPSSNSALVYALIRRLNERKRLVVYVIERELTYLVSHAESIVIQAELGTDIATFEQGIEAAFVFSPDILFLGDLWPSDDVPGLRHAAGADLLTIVSSVSISAPPFHDAWTPGPGMAGAATRQYPQFSVQVTPQGGGRLDVTLESAPTSSPT